MDFTEVLEAVTDFTEVSEVTEDVGFTEGSTEELVTDSGEVLEAVGFTEVSDLVDWATEAVGFTEGSEVTEAVDSTEVSEAGEVLELVDGEQGSPTPGLTIVVITATTAEATGVDVKLTFLEHSMLNDDANLTAK
jgi:hypothetical protein